MATRDKEWQTHVVDERGDRDAVLAVISSTPSITIEELLQQLPYMRWGYLFSILGEVTKKDWWHFPIRTYDWNLRQCLV